MALLLIEDDQSIILSLTIALNNAGFEVDSANDGLKGLELAKTGKYDLILLDCNLPGRTGFEIVKELRDSNIFTPIIILTVLGEINNKIELFNLGSDDYLTKPFALAELLARIRALLRRPRNLQGGSIKIGNLELDHDKFRLTKKGRFIPLSVKEFSLLEYLMINQGRYLSRQKIMEKIWDENADPFSNTIEVHIMNLRKKIETKKEHYIFTATGRGYKIDTLK